MDKSMNSSSVQISVLPLMSYEIWGKLLMPSASVLSSVNGEDGN